MPAMAQCMFDCFGITAHLKMSSCPLNTFNSHTGSDCQCEYCNSISYCAITYSHLPLFIDCALLSNLRLFVRFNYLPFVSNRITALVNCVATFAGFGSN